MRKIYFLLLFFTFACNKAPVAENVQSRKFPELTAVNYSVCPTPTNCHLTFKSTIENFNVYKHDSSGAILYKAKFAVDADGSPRAYGPNNSGLDYTANAGSPGNWWGVATDPQGNPYIQHPGEPYPGMYVSTTSLVYSGCVDSLPCRYVDSENVPYYVIPSAVKNYGITIGDVAFVYNTVSKKGCYAIYADSGPAGKLGEGSMYLATQLGLNNSPKTGGTSSGIIDYIIFPGSGLGQGKIPMLTQINNIGAAHMKKLGGLKITNCL